MVVNLTMNSVPLKSRGVEIRRNGRIKEGISPHSDTHTQWTGLKKGELAAIAVGR